MFDDRVQVPGPALAEDPKTRRPEDPLNVPISVHVDPALGPIEQSVVMVDRNPIRKVLVHCPMHALPSLALRFKVMHPMDTGAVGGIPAFQVNRLSVRDSGDRELARLQTFEPVSENPVFSFDFTKPPVGGVQVVGTDNNGNRITSRVE